MRNILVTSYEMLRQLQAFELDARLRELIVDPAQLRIQYPAIAPDVFVFEQPYYRLAADDRSQVHEEVRTVFERTERMLMQHVFDVNYRSKPVQLSYLEHQGRTVYFDFGRGASLVWLQLARAIFYVDVNAYISVNPTNTGDTACETHHHT